MRIPAFVTAVLSGLLFGTGLVISGMTEPANILAFLDIAGDWDPGMAVVMGVAIGVAAPAFRFVKRRGRSLDQVACDIVNRGPIDRPLLAGAVVFGVGWGMSGICPGPGLMLAASGVGPALVFVGGLALGMVIASRFLPISNPCARP